MFEMLYFKEYQSQIFTDIYDHHPLFHMGFPFDCNGSYDENVILPHMTKLAILI